MMFRLPTLLCLLGFATVLRAQSMITVSLPQTTDSTLVTLARHQIGKLLRVDSAWVHIGKKEVSLQPGKEYGLYSIIPKGKPPVAITWTQPQPFRVEILFDTLNQFVADFENSPENTAYHQYFNLIRPYTNRVSALRTQYDVFRKMGLRDRSAYDDVNRELGLAQDSIKLMQEAATNAHPGHFWAKMLKSMAAPTIPEELKSAEQSPAVKQKINQYFKAHYWDNYDFQDERMYYTAVYHGKLEQWLGMHLIHVDTLISAIDQVLKIVEKYPKYKNHTLAHLITRFEQPDIFDGDKVLVYVADKYFTKVGDGDTDPASYERVKYKADAFRHTLNGMTAPAITLQDSAQVLRSLSDVKAEYTVLYFFSPMCDKCREVTPKVAQYLQPYHPSKVQVFAVTLDDRQDFWRTYIKDLPGWTCVHDTTNPHPIEKLYVHPGLPAIYLLDKDKKIIAKRFTAEKLAEILSQLVGHTD